MFIPQKNLLNMKKICLVPAVLAAIMAFSTQTFAQKKEKDKVLANKTYTVEITETSAKKPKTVNDEFSFTTYIPEFVEPLMKSLLPAMA